MITVVIPTKNEEKNLPNLLQSLKKQKYKKSFEVLVVDANSKDKTIEIAKKYKCRVIQQKKGGISTARNLGWKNARGEIVIFLDADYTLNNTFLKEIEKFFAKNKQFCARPSIDFVQNNWLQKVFLADIEFNKKQKHWKFPIIAFRKELLKIIGGFDERVDFGEDKEIAWRLLKNGYKIGFVKRAKVTIKPVDNLVKLFTQGRWYGRNLLRYISKTKDLSPLAGILIYIPFLPLLILSFLNKIFLFFFSLNVIFLMFHMLKTYFSTLNLYAFLLLPFNIIKNFGELIGLIEGKIIYKS
jgi:cellulose synthase/poly-beta-1,6-N-acetylglucosamine synthase-like glycosyltransferase